MNDKLLRPSDCVIVANGDMPTHPLATHALRGTAYVIACDGALQSLLGLGVEPDAVVGDLDSLDEALRSRYADRIYHVADQDTNDLTKAMRWARAHGFRCPTVVGATGRREDHALGNIALLADNAQVFEALQMVTDYGVFTVMTEPEQKFASEAGMAVSIFSFAADAHITTSGLHWPIDGPLTALWQGTLNRAEGDSFAVAASPGSKVLVYRAFG